MSDTSVCVCPNMLNEVMYAISLIMFGMGISLLYDILKDKLCKPRPESEVPEQPEQPKPVKSQMDLAVEKLFAEKQRTIRLLSRDRPVFYDVLRQRFFFRPSQPPTAGTRALLIGGGSVVRQVNETSRLPREPVTRPPPGLTNVVPRQPNLQQQTQQQQMVEARQFTCPTSVGEMESGLARSPLTRLPPGLPQKSELQLQLKQQPEMTHEPLREKPPQRLALTPSPPSSPEDEEIQRFLELNPYLKADLIHASRLQQQMNGAVGNARAYFRPPPGLTQVTPQTPDPEQEQNTRADSPMPVGSITAYPVHRWQEWHQSISPDLRNNFVRKLMQAICQTVNPSVQRDQRLRDLVADAKDIESEVFEIASTRSEYYHLIAEEIHKIEKDIDIKHRRKGRQARLLQQQQLQLQFQQHRQKQELLQRQQQEPQLQQELQEQYQQHLQQNEQLLQSQHQQQQEHLQLQQEQHQEQLILQQKHRQEQLQLQQLQHQRHEQQLQLYEQQQQQLLLPQQQQQEPQQQEEQQQLLLPQHQEQLQQQEPQQQEEQQQQGQLLQIQQQQQ